MHPEESKPLAFPTRPHFFFGAYKFNLRHLGTTLFVFFSFASARCYLHTLFPALHLLPKYNLELWVRVLSTLHAAAASIMAILYLARLLSDEAFTNGCCFSIGYLWADSLMDLYQQRGSAVIYLIHHLILFLLLLFAAKDQFRLVAQGLLGELISLPHTCCWYMLHVNQTGNSRFLCASILLLLLYFTTRVANFTYLCYRLYQERAKGALLFFVPLTSMSYYWFYLICQKATHVFLS